jgi:phage/plasmid-like protein (TIGR03299 family)
MSQEWMDRFDKAEIRLSPEEQLEQQTARVEKRTGIEKDDWVATGDDEKPWWLPWQKTSTVLPGKMTVKEALEYSHLAGWDLKKVPLYAPPTWPADQPVPTTSYQPVPGWFGVQRSTDSKILGVVQGRYEIVSNESAFDWAEYLLGGDGSMFTSAGSLKGGRVVFLVASTPFKVELTGADELETYLLISNRHDGLGQVTCSIVTIRVVCQNTLERSLAGALSTVTIRHTKSAQDKLGMARQTLGMAQGATNRAAEIAEAMIAKSMSDSRFKRFLADLLPETEELTPRQVRGVMKRREAIEEVYQDHPTVTMLDHTDWRAYSAVTFVNDHMITRRNIPSSDSSPEESRMLSVIGGSNLGTRAFELLTSS